jgi:hypothetical protein
MAFSFKNIRLDGCKLGPLSPKDYRTTFKDDSIPDKVDLRPFCTPVENQGQLGSCTANASVGALEFLYKKNDGRSVDLSRLFVYFNARRMTGQTNEDSGCYIREAMASILAFGVCREDTWPYNAGKFAEPPTKEAYSEALKYGAIQYSRVSGGKGAISALAAGYPVVFGTSLPMRCYEEAATTGVIPQPTEEERQAPPKSGHSMLIVGYDKRDERFIVRNSWGEDWGNRGYCTMPFGVIEDFSMFDELWIVTFPEEHGTFTVIRPNVESTARPATRPLNPEPTISRLASSMRNEIRSSLTRDLAASSQKVENLLRGAIPAREPAHRAEPPRLDHPLTVSPGSWSSFSTAFGDEPNPPDADDKKFFHGVWRGRFEVVGMSCSAEIIFQPNGDYSSLSQSDNGWYAFRAVGTWQLLGQGNMQIHYNDHDPKEWNGKKLEFPENENIHFQVLNKNKMKSVLCEWQRSPERK